MGDPFTERGLMQPKVSFRKIIFPYKNIWFEEDFYVNSEYGNHYSIKCCFSNVSLQFRKAKKLYNICETQFGPRLHRMKIFTLLYLKIQSYQEYSINNTYFARRKLPNKDSTLISSSHPTSFDVRQWRFQQPSDAENHSGLNSRFIISFFEDAFECSAVEPAIIWNGWTRCTKVLHLANRKEIFHQCLMGALSTIFYEILSKSLIDVYSVRILIAHMLYRWKWKTFCVSIETNDRIVPIY